MDDSQSEQSLTREKLRLLLFPDLSPEEARLRIDAAFAGAQDEERAGRWAGSDKLECGIHLETPLQGGT